MELIVELLVIELDIELLIPLRQCSRALYSVFNSSYIVELLTVKYNPRDTFTTLVPSFWTSLYWYRCRTSQHQFYRIATAPPAIRYPLQPHMRDIESKIRTCTREEAVACYLENARYINNNGLFVQWYTNVVPYAPRIETVVDLCRFNTRILTPEISDAYTDDEILKFSHSLVTNQLLSSMFKARVILGDVRSAKIMSSIGRLLGHLHNTILGENISYSTEMVEWIVSVLKDTHRDTLSSYFEVLVTNGYLENVHLLVEYWEPRNKIECLICTCIRGLKIDSITYLLSLNVKVDWKKVSYEFLVGRMVQYTLASLHLLLSMKECDGSEHTDLINSYKGDCQKHMFEYVLRRTSDKVNWDTLYKKMQSNNYPMWHRMLIRELDIKYNNGNTGDRWKCESVLM